MFHKMQAHVGRINGRSQAALARKLANRYNISEETIHRMLDGETSTNAVLTGTDRLFEFLMNDLAKSQQQVSTD